MASRWLVFLPFAIGACSYPDFAFTPQADVAVDTARPSDDSAKVQDDTAPPPVDSAMVDSTIQQDSGIDSTIDSTTDSRMDSVADSRMDSTIDSTTDSMTDSMKVDSALPDTKIDAADTSVLTGCALPHDFCRNFDTVTAYDDGWTNTFGTAPGTMSFETTKWTSPSKSFVASITASSTATASSMLAQHFTVPSSTTVITTEADIMVDAITYSSTYDIILFKVQRSSDGDGVFLTVGSTGLLLATQGSSSNRYPITGVTAGKWFHVKLESVLHTTSGVAKIWIDGVLAESRSGVSTANVDDTNRQFLVGVFSYMGAVPFKARFDDVSYDVP